MQNSFAARIGLAIFFTLWCSANSSADIYHLECHEGAKLTLQHGLKDTFVIVIEPAGSVLRVCGQQNGKNSTTPSTLLLCSTNGNVVQKIASKSTSQAFVIEGNSAKEIPIKQSSYKSLWEYLWKSTRSTDEVRTWLMTSGQSREGKAK